MVVDGEKEVVRAVAQLAPQHVERHRDGFKARRGFAGDNLPSKVAIYTFRSLELGRFQPSARTLERSNDSLSASL